MKKFLLSLIRRNKKQHNKEMPVMYETDDIKQAELVASGAPNITVVYHNPNRKISPTLTSIIEGRSYTKYNPEYIEYLKEKHPGISDDEIARLITQAVAESLSEETQLSSNDATHVSDTFENSKSR